MMSSRLLTLRLPRNHGYPAGGHHRRTPAGRCVDVLPGWRRSGASQPETTRCRRAGGRAGRRRSASISRGLGPHKFPLVSVFHYARLNHGLYGYMLYLTPSHYAADHVLYNTITMLAILLSYTCKRSSRVRSVRPGTADTLEPSSLLRVESPIRTPERSELPSGEHACFTPKLASQSSAQLRLVKPTDEYSHANIGQGSLTMVGDSEDGDGAPGNASCSHPRVCCTSTSPKFSSQICQRHSSQSVARLAGGKKRSVHHSGSSRPMTTGASGENGKPVCPRVVRTVGRRLGADTGAGAIAAEAWRSWAIREAYSNLGGVVVKLPGKRTTRGV